MTHRLTRDFELSVVREAVKRTGALFCGVDEAGRGPLAGPVVAAACLIPEGLALFEGIEDSKRTTEEDRERLYGELTAHGEVVWAVSVVDDRRIDEINILAATMEAMTGAVASLQRKARGLAYALIDGNRVPAALPVPAQAVVKGDSKCYSIAAASILAKVTRDRIMLDLHAQYPQYEFNVHKGYPTPAHMALVKQHGRSPVHRLTFAPLKTMYPEECLQRMGERGQQKKREAEAKEAKKATKKVKK
jgi:ribonuclease HII